MMTRIKLPYVDSFTDRTGRARYYFRKRPAPRIPLPGLPGSTEFMAAYKAAIDEAVTPAPNSVKRTRSEPGTFDNLAQLYFESTTYARLKPISRYAYKLTIERLIRDENIGHRLVKQMTRTHVERIVTKRAGTPAAANDVLKKIRILLRFAIDNGWRLEDTTLRVRRFDEGEHHTWTDEEIAAFEQRWPVGTRERTVFALFLYTGQRVSDVRKMSWRDVDGQAVRVRQQKTGTDLWIPLHPALSAILEQWPRLHMVMLTTDAGEPFTANGLGSWLSRRIERTGLPERCVPHGLRKAAARRLAEAGCTAHQIMAITGHQSLKEVERYTKAAEQKGLAHAAIERLEAHTTNKLAQTEAHNLPKPQKT